MRVHLTAVAVALALMPVAAAADEISGDWCSGAGARIFIDGDRVTSPGGQVTDGLYSRHAYAFTIPEGETDAGADVRMQQVSEQQVLVQIGDGAVEEWRRCMVVS